MDGEEVSTADEEDSTADEEEDSAADEEEDSTADEGSSTMDEGDSTTNDGEDFDMDDEENLEMSDGEDSAAESEESSAVDDEKDLDASDEEDPDMGEEEDLATDGEEVLSADDSEDLMANGEDYSTIDDEENHSAFPRTPNPEVCPCFFHRWILPQKLQPSFHLRGRESAYAAGIGEHLLDIRRREGSPQLDGLFLGTTQNSDNRDLRELYSMTSRMLRNSETQFEEIGRILCEFLEHSQTVNRPRQRAPALQQPRERRRRTAIDPGLRVGLPPLAFYEHLTNNTTKAQVRQHALLMLGRINTSSLVPAPPDPQLIEEFDANESGGPNEGPGQFRLDLEGSVRSPWNMRAAQCFRESFNKSELYRKWPDDIIEEAFLRHIETIRTHYRQQTGRISTEETMDRRIRSARRSRAKTVGVICSLPSASH